MGEGWDETAKTKNNLKIKNNAQGRFMNRPNGRLNIKDHSPIEDRPLCMDKGFNEWGSRPVEEIGERSFLFDPSFA